MTSDPSSGLLRPLPDAHEIGHAFWIALGNDDDAAAHALLVAARREEWSVSGFAAAYREARDISRQQCLLLNFFDQIEVLAVDRLRFSYSAMPVGRVEKDEPIVVWRLELSVDDGEWRVDDRTTLEPIRTIRLS